MNRRQFLTVGAGSAAAAAATGSTVLALTSSSSSADAYTFRGVAALPTDHRFPNWGSYVVEGHVNLSRRTGSLTRSVYAGPPDAMSHIALLSHAVRVEDVRENGALLHIKGVVDDRSHLMRGETDKVLLIIDRNRGTITTDFFRAALNLKLD
jgi:hypothetical protein